MQPRCHPAAPLAAARKLGDLNTGQQAACQQPLLAAPAAPPGSLGSQLQLSHPPLIAPTMIPFFRSQSAAPPALELPLPLHAQGVRLSNNPPPASAGAPMRSACGAAGQPPRLWASTQVPSRPATLSPCPDGHTPASWRRGERHCPNAIGHRRFGPRQNKLPVTRPAGSSAISAPPPSLRPVTP